MVVGVKLLEPLSRDMGVDLGRRQVAVAKQHLHHPQIGAVVEQMGGEGVAQGVRREVFADARLQGVTLDELPERLARHAVAAASGEEEVAQAPAQQVLAWPMKVIPQPVQRFRPKGHQALLPSLPCYPHDALDQARLLWCEPHQLRHPQPGRVEHLQHGAISVTARVFRIRGLQQGFHLRLGKGLWQGASELWGLDPGAGIFLDGSLSQQVLVKLTQAGQEPGRGAGLAALTGEQRQIVQQVDAPGRAQVPFPLPPEPTREQPQVGLVGGKRARAQAALHPEGVGESLDEVTVFIVDHSEELIC